MSSKEKLNSTLLKRLEKCKNVANRTRICTYLGISHTTFYRWLDEGKQLKNDLPDRNLTTDEKNVIKFYELVEYADTEVEIAMLDSIERASFDNWQAAKYLLQCRFPKNYVPAAPINLEDLEYKLRQEAGDNKTERIMAILQEDENEEQSRISSSSSESEDTEATDEASDSEGGITLEERVSAPSGRSLKPPGEVSS